jgi:hypothetical protein
MWLLVAMAGVVSYKYVGPRNLLNALETALLPAFVFLFTAFIVGFHFIELQVKKKKFAAWFNEPVG